jgi:hypothetical protein
MLSIVLAYLDGCRRCPMQAALSACNSSAYALLFAAERGILSTLDMSQAMSVYYFLRDVTRSGSSKCSASLEQLGLAGSSLL